MKKTIIHSLCLLFLLLFSISTNAQEMHFSVQDAATQVGGTVTVPIYADSTFTGQDIRSYQLRLTYSTSYFEVLEVQAGAIAAQGTMEANITVPGEITVAGAKGSAFTDTGVFCYVTLVAIRSGGSGISMTTTSSTSYFNEGGSTITATSGYISIASLPSINIYPSTSTLLLGDSVQLSVSGDEVAPLYYTVDDPTVGSITASGMFHSLKAGSTRISVKDANGTVASTGIYTVKGYKLSIPTDLSVYQGDTILVPVNTTTLSGQDIISGSFQLSYSSSALNFIGIDTKNGLLENTTSHSSSLDGKVTVAFASTETIEGQGTLLYLKYVVTFDALSTSFSFSNAILNESLDGLYTSGYLRVNSLPDLYLSPNSKTIYAGDEVALSVTNGTAPYVFTVSNTELASIDENGVLKALRGGKVKVTVVDAIGASTTSSYFTIYDTHVEIPDTTGPVGASYDLPVFVDDIPEGIDISSFEMELSYDSSELQFVEIIQEETLTQGWTFLTSQKSSSMIIASAGSQVFNEKGVLFYIRFNLTDNMTLGETEYLNISDFIFNEGSPNLTTENGRIVAVRSEDLNVSKVISPLTDCSHSDHEYITIEVSNSGYIDYDIGDSILVSYYLNYGVEHRDTIVLSQVLASGEKLEYTFMEPIDLSSVRSYHLKAKTLLSAERDGNIYNDSKEVYIETYGRSTVSLDDDIEVYVGDTVDVTCATVYDSCIWSTGIIDEYSIQVSKAEKGIDTCWIKVFNAQGCEAIDTILISFIKKDSVFDDYTVLANQHEIINDHIIVNTLTLLAGSSISGSGTLEVSNLIDVESCAEISISNLMFTDSFNSSLTSSVSIDCDTLQVLDNANFTSAGSVLISKLIVTEDAEATINSLVINSNGIMINDGILDVDNCVLSDSSSSIVSGTLEASSLTINDQTHLSVSGTCQVSADVYVLGDVFVEANSHFGNKNTYINFEFMRDEFKYFTPPFNITASTLGTVMFDVTSPSTSESVWLYYYDEAGEAANANDNSWKLITKDTTLFAGKGYAAWFSFEGGSVNKMITLHDTVPYPNMQTYASEYIQYTDIEGSLSCGYNAIGNTYSLPLSIPSDYDVRAFYYFDGGKYLTMSGEGIPLGSAGVTDLIIPSYSCFYTQMISTGDFTFSLDDLNNSSDAVRIKSTTSNDPEYIRITVQNDTLYDDAILRFTDNASLVYDDYDVAKMLSSSSNMEISTSFTDGVGFYAIQSLPSLDALSTYEELDIPLKFSTTNSSIFSISTQFVNLTTDQLTLYLYDQLTEELTILGEELLSIALLTTYDKTQRYHVKLFADDPSVIDVGDIEEVISVYTSNNILYVRNLNDVVGTITVLDVSGKQILTAGFSGSSVIPLSDLSKGMYIVYVTAEDQLSVLKRVLVQ